MRALAFIVKSGFVADERRVAKPGPAVCGAEALAEAEGAGDAELAHVS
jgi:hypothetical protein